MGKAPRGLIALAFLARCDAEVAVWVTNTVTMYVNGGKKCCRHRTMAERKSNTEQDNPCGDPMVVTSSFCQRQETGSHLTDSTI